MIPQGNKKETSKRFVNNNQEGFEFTLRIVSKKTKSNKFTIGKMGIGHVTSDPVFYSFWVFQLHYLIFPGIITYH